MNPAIKTVRVGSLSIDLRRFADGRVGFDIEPPGEVRKKVRATTVERAEAKALELLGMARGGKVSRMAIDEREYAEFLRWKAERTKGGTVEALTTSFLAARKARGNSTEHLIKVEQDLTAFGVTFGARRIDDISRAEVSAWLESRDVGPRRFNNILATVISLFRFARREQCLGANLSGAELVERRHIPRHRVEIYTPEELRALLGAVPAEWVPFVCFGAFAGIRPQELCAEPRSGKPSLQWENVLWESAKIEIPALVSKVRRRRHVTLLPVLASWLAPWRDASGPVAPRVRVCHLTAGWSKKAGVRWVPDGLRHSFASYRLAITHDAPRLSLELGNSVGVLMSNYAEATMESDALKWFGIEPSLNQANPLTSA